MTDSLLNIEDDTEQQREKSALTDREWSLINSLSEVCMILAQEPTIDKAIESVEDALVVSTAEARRWIAKAQEYMATGCVNNVAQAKQMYQLRLEHIYSVAIKNAVTDDIEVTQKPVKIVDDTAAGAGKTKVVYQSITKVKKNTLNPAALSIAFKVLREQASLNGLRPKESRGPVPSGNVNVQINLGEESARVVSMSTQDLASMVGAEYVANEAPGDGQEPRPEILPNATGEEEGTKAAEQGGEDPETPDRSGDGAG